MTLIFFSKSENAQCLALSAISNVAGVEIALALANEVAKLLCSPNSRAIVKKKGALCMLRLFRRTSECISAEDWAVKLVNLIDDRNTAVVMTVLTLLGGICSVSSEGYESAVPRVVRLLTKVIINRDYVKDYVYANVPCPWLQVLLLFYC